MSADSAFCSLHDAILAANTDSPVGGCAAGDGDDVIDLSGMSGTILLDAPLPPITDSLTLVGAGAADLTIARHPDAPPFRIFTIQGSAVLLGDLTVRGGEEVIGGGILLESGDLILHGVQVANNRASSSGGGIAVTGGSLALTVGTAIVDNHAGSSGGGLYADGGSITITDSSIARNQAVSSGGGLYASGDTIVTGSLFHGNQADSAGGAIAQMSGSLVMRSSTITDNQARMGGGMVIADGVARAEHVTIAYNQADQGGGVLSSTALDLHASILSDNTGANCHGTVRSQGDNLSSDQSCTLNAVGDRANESARLSALEAHGGLTRVHLLDSDSPARGAASQCGGVDQRGASRPASGCDIGAVETPASVPVQWIAATSGDWNTASNWDTGTIPSASSDVILNVPAAVTVRINVNVTVNSITSDEHIQQTSGTVTVAAASTFGGAYTLTAGTLTGAGARTLTGNTTWTGGTLSGTGPITNSGTMTLSGTASKFISGSTVTNSGAIVWTGGSIYLNSSAVLNNAASGTLFAHASDGEVSWTSNPAGQFTNAGTIFGTGGVFYPSPGVNDAPQAAVGSGRVYFTAPFVNTGTVNAQRGTIDLNGTSTSSGSYLGAVRVIAGTHTLTNGAAIDGGSLTGGTLVIAENATVSAANFTQTNGTLNLMSGATSNLTNATLSGGTANLRGTIAGVVTVSGGSLNLYLGTTIAGALTLNGGNLDSVETASVTGDLFWTGGAIYGTGLTITPAGELIIDGVSDKVVSSSTVITNNGAARFISDSRILCAFCSGGTLQNNGTFTVNVPGGAEAEFANVNLNNAGTLTLQTPFYVWRGTSPGTFVGGANAVLRTDNITLSAGAQINGAITYSSGAITASGTATVNGDLIWAGGAIYGTGLTIAPAGELIIDGLSDKLVSSSTLITNNGATSFISDSRIVCSFCSGGTLQNNGTFTVNVPGGAEAEFANVNLNNAGTLTLQTPFYVWRGTSPGTFVGGANAVLRTDNITLSAGAQINGAITYTNGAITASGTATVNGDLTWAGGFIYDTGLTIAPAGELIIDGLSDKLVSSSTLITNNGTARFISDSRIVCSFCSGGTLQNNGTFTVNVPGGAEAEFTNVNLNNAGTLTLQTPFYVWRSTSPGTFVGEANAVLRTDNITLSAGAQINGALTFASGFITATGTATVNGDLIWTGGDIYGTGLTIAPAGELIIDGAADKWVNSGTVITNNGTARFISASRVVCSFCSGGAFTNNGLLTVTVPSAAQAEFTNVNLNNHGTVDITSGTFYAWRGTSTGTFVGNGTTLRTDNITLNAGVQINGALTFASGFITANGTATVNGDLTWTGGDIYGPGLTIAPAGELIIDGAADKWVNSGTLITNNGITRFNSASRIVCSFCSGGTFQNNGTLTVNFPTGTTAQFTNVNLANAGTITIQTGTLYSGRTVVQSAGSLNLSGGNLEANLTLSGGTLTGSGTITGAVTNNATVHIGAAPGTLTISGSYTQGSAGALTAQIGGATPGTGHDRLAVSGAVTLAGALNLALINSYDPPLGTLFDIITYGSRSGTFTTVAGTAIGGGKQFTPSYPAGKVTITTAAA